MENVGFNTVNWRPSVTGPPIPQGEKMQKREPLGVNHPQTSMCFLGDNKSKAKFHIKETFGFNNKNEVETPL